MKIAHLHVWDKKNKGDVGIVEAVQDLLRKNFNNPEIVDVPVEQLKLGGKIWLEAINDCDLTVIGGGGIYYHWFLPYNIEFISQIKPPIIIFGVGYINEFGAPSLSEKEKLSIVYLNQKAVLRSVRDDNTYKFLRENGFKKKVSIIGDPAVLLEEVSVNLNFKKISVGFNLNYSGWLGFGQYQKEILLSYRECIDELRLNYDAKIFYLLHHPGEYNIIPKIEREVEVIDLPAKEQKYVYGKLNLVIGMMLHSGVMAFGAGTPILSIAYDIRNLSFAKFIGHEELVIKPEDLKPGVLKEKMIFLLKNEKKYRLNFAKKKKNILLKTKDFLEKINSLNNP